MNGFHQVCAGCSLSIAESNTILLISVGRTVSISAHLLQVLFATKNKRVWFVFSFLLSILSVLSITLDLFICGLIFFFPDRQHISYESLFQYCGLAGLASVQLEGLRDLVQHCRGSSIHATDLSEFPVSCSSQCHGQQVGSARLHI